MRRKKKILSICLAVMLALVPLRASATARVVENLDENFLVREHVKLSGEALPGGDLILMINMRDVVSADFFEQLREVDEMAQGEYAVILVGNDSYVLKDFAENLDTI